MTALAKAFADQVETSHALGSPFMATLMSILPEVLPSAPQLCAVLSNWPGDVSSRGASLPLRLAGGLHALVRSGKAPELAPCYPPALGPGLKVALSATLERQEDWLLDWITLPPQTNEVGRSAVLIAAARFVRARYALPLRLSELGASAGLNLNFDRYFLDNDQESYGVTGVVRLRPEWSGNAPSPLPVHVQDRRGVDLSPVNPVKDADRLLAYVWPDQAERLSRLRLALDLGQSHPVTVDQGDAAAWLEARLGLDSHGLCHFVYHTIAHQYFPDETKARIFEAMAQAGAVATPQSPLAWFGMEADGHPKGAALTLRLWPGPEVWVLGRAGFHGQWVDWAPRRVS